MAGFFSKKQYAAIADKELAIKLLNERCLECSICAMFFNSSILPQFSQFPYFLVSMYARIVKHDERIFLYVQGKGVKVFNDLVRVNTFSRGNPMIAVVPVYHAEDVDPLCLWGWDIHVFVTELPTVRHIAFGAQYGI